MFNFVTGAFLLCFFNQGESVELTLTSPAVHFRAGTSVTLSCNIFDLEDTFFIQGGSVGFFQHMNDERRQLAYFSPTFYNTTSPGNKVSSTRRSDRYIVDLKMTDLELESEGEYQCAIYRNNILELASRGINLKFLKTASIEYPKCDAYTQDNRLHLTCESFGSVPSPDLVWSHDEDIVSRNTALKYGGHSNAIDVNLTDIHGTFECRFYYVGGGINDERSCRIELPYMIFILPANTKFISGSSAKITVLARASPPMKTPVRCNWNHTDTAGFSVKSDSNDLAVITIPDVDVSMNVSQITCCGRNLLGENCQSMVLFVESSLPNECESREPPVTTKRPSVTTTEPLPTPEETSTEKAGTNRDLIQPVIIVILFSMLVLSAAVAIFLRARDKKKHKSSELNYFETEMRSPSFTSTSTASQHSNADSGINLHDVPCGLKRSATVPASRSLPAPPLSSLPQVHGHDGTTKNETYSVIKTDQHPYLKEPNLQPYMDMGGRKKPGKLSPTYSDELLPFDNSTGGKDFIGSQDDEGHEGFGKDHVSECSPLVTDSTEKVGYLEVKKDPNSQCPYQDLEDLYRETASNNLYAP